MEKSMEIILLAVEISILEFLCYLKDAFYFVRI